MTIKNSDIRDLLDVTCDNVPELHDYKLCFRSNSNGTLFTGKSKDGKEITIKRSEVINCRGPERMKLLIKKAKSAL